MDIHRHVVELINNARRFALAVVMRAERSAPRREGTKAIIDETGRIWGTIGGGAVEAETQRRAIEAIRSNQPVVFEFHLAGESVADADPICGGKMRILIDPTAAKDRASYANAAEALAKRRRGVLVTAIRTAPRTNVSVQWVAEDAIPSHCAFPGADAIRSCLVSENARSFSHEGHAPSERVEVLVDPVIPKPLLLIAGGGHIGQALAHQAILIDFDVIVIDDRPEFTDPALFPPGVATRRGDIAKELGELPVAGDTYIVIVTRGHKHDAAALASCIRSPAAYVGMIGSKRKVSLMRKDFVESGRATKEEFDRVFAPIGLDIGAVTVPEIAASIAAQLIMVRRKANARSIVNKRTPR